MDNQGRERLWSMSASERIDAMWSGELSLSELVEWTRRAPGEVPLAGGEFAWIVARTPEWAG